MSIRVAHIIKINNIAGAERHLLALIGALCERGLDIHLLMMVDPQQPMIEMERRASEAGAHVIRLIIRSDLDVLMIPRLVRHLRSIKPDLVHTHLIHGDTFGIPAAHIAGKPVVSSRHDDSDFRRSWFYRRLNRLLWRGVDRGIAISHALAQFSIDVEGAPADRTRVVHYGITHTPVSQDALVQARDALRAELHLAPQSLLLGVICRLIPLKRVDDAVLALARLSYDHPDMHLVIVGDGPERANLEKLVMRQDLVSKVHFMGWQSQVERVFAGLDVLLVPSTREGFGLVLLEAMSKRVPVIASAVSAIPEVVIDGETGLLVSPRDPDALAQAVRTLADDRALRAHMGMMGEDRLETHFSVARMADETIAVYQELL